VSTAIAGSEDPGRTVRLRRVLRLLGHTGGPARAPEATGIRLGAPATFAPRRGPWTYGPCRWRLGTEQPVVCPTTTSQRTVAGWITSDARSTPSRGAPVSAMTDGGPGWIVETVAKELRISAAPCGDGTTEPKHSLPARREVCVPASSIRWEASGLPKRGWACPTGIGCAPKDSPGTRRALSDSRTGRR
jgi:hypothetical protein